MADHPHPPKLAANADGLWSCSACTRKVPEMTAIFGQYECLACRWRDVIWVACSRRCMALIQAELAPAMRGQRGGAA